MRYWHVDAFTDEAFHGNPCAVVLLDRALAEEQLAALALEFNLPATVFVRVTSPREVAIRWFTPLESGLCGHGTLAAVHALWESGVATSKPLVLSSQAGPLEARSENGWVALDFPTLSLPPRAAWPELARALGAEIEAIAADTERTLVQLASVQDVRASRPDFAQLEALGLRKLILTAHADDSAYDFVSRYFKAEARGGYAEDPVTGSAHCCLAPFWAPKLGKRTFSAYQASLRGGVLEVALEGARTVLRGRAVTVAEGTLRV